jgi:cysteinyl-tRNA synthetase
LEGSEKAFKRLWEAYEVLQKLQVASGKGEAKDTELNAKIIASLKELEEFMDDDMNTAKVIANLFDLAPIINSIKDGHIAADAIAASTLELMKQSFKTYLEDILGLHNPAADINEKLDGIMQLLVDIRKEAKLKKDYATSDKIRIQLTELGIDLKDDKSGETTWVINH